MPSVIIRLAFQTAVVTSPFHLSSCNSLLMLALSLEHGVFQVCCEPFNLALFPFFTTVRITKRRLSCSQSVECIRHLHLTHAASAVTDFFT